jgi:hypothetical protein
MVKLWTWLVNICRFAENRVVLVKKGTLKAVHDYDLEPLLHSLGLYEKVQGGECFCDVCGEKVTMENIQCIYPQDGEIKFCCSASFCYKKMVAHGKVS